MLDQNTISFDPFEQSEQFIACNLNSLSLPLRRVLRMQMREFIHFLDDVDDGLAANGLIKVTAHGLDVPMAAGSFAAF